MVVAPQLLADQAGEQVRPALDPVFGCLLVGRARRRKAPQEAGSAQLGDDGGDDPQHAGRLTPVAKKVAGGPIDRRRQLGVGQVPALDAKPQRARGDRTTQPVLAARLAQVQDDPVTGARRLAVDDVDELEAARNRADGGGQQPLRVRTLDEERAPATGLQGLDGRCEPVAKRGRLGAGRLAAAAEDRLEAQGLGSLAAQDPGGREVLVGQLVDRRAGRRRAEDEVDAVRREVLPDDRGPGAQPEDVRGAHPAQLAVVGGKPHLAAPARDGADCRADVVERLLERAPRVDFALVAARRLADVAGRDPKRRHSARVAVQARGG